MNTYHGKDNQVIVRVELTMNYACGDKAKTYKKNVENSKYNCPYQQVHCPVGGGRHDESGGDIKLAPFFVFNAEPQLLLKNKRFEYNPKNERSILFPPRGTNCTLKREKYPTPGGVFIVDIHIPAIFCSIVVVQKPSTYDDLTVAWPIDFQKTLTN